MGRASQWLSDVMDHGGNVRNVDYFQNRRKTKLQELIQAAQERGGAGPPTPIYYEVNVPGGGSRQTGGFDRVQEAQDDLKWLRRDLAEAEAEALRTAPARQQANQAGLGLAGLGGAGGAGGYALKESSHDQPAHTGNPPMNKLAARSFDLGAINAINDSGLMPGNSPLVKVAGLMDQGHSFVEAWPKVSTAPVPQDLAQLICAA